MSTQTVTQQVQWQDLKVRSELDVVLEIAKREGWQDCEIFGNGAMLAQPREAKGWKLVPADQYKYSIPRQAVGRLSQVINAGVRIQGVIIADDQRRAEASPAPARPAVRRPSAAGKIASFLGKVLLGLILVAGAIALLASMAPALIILAPLFLLGALTGTKFDPKLVILVDDGNGGTVWVSLFTWYD
jgi:hypothetical protein